MTTALHLFRRDLRLSDNTALAAAAHQHTSVIVGFIFDPRQVSDQNGYKSLKALRFLCESLSELSEAVSRAGGTLNIWYGQSEKVLSHILTNHDITSVHVNADYTPFSRDRDAILEKVCSQHNVSFTAHHDTLLVQPGTVATGSGQPFKVFTPFYKRALQETVPSPLTTIPDNLFSGTIAGATTTIPQEITQQYATESESAVASGRKAALKILKNADSFGRYKERRDLLAANATTHLSAHHKFGTVSIREVHHAISQALGSAGEPLIRQLYWRDFFTHVAFSFPHVFGNAFNTQYNDIAWRNNEKEFEKWCTGTTGFPIVDAGMRELNETGYMHNRARMIVASFLTKDLHIDWRWGERYFAQKLVDYDPCVNNGSWQWAASTGCDAQPYFRIFNPWLQQKRFDPDARYIKRWVTELKTIRPEALHVLDQKPFQIPNYPQPMCDHRTRAEQAKALFK